MKSRKISLIGLGLVAVALSLVGAVGVVFADHYLPKTVEPVTIPLWGPSWDHSPVTVSVGAGKGVSDAAIVQVRKAIDDWNHAIGTIPGAPSAFLVPPTGGAKAKIIIKVKSGGGMVQGQALCKSEGGFFTDCKVNVSGKAFGSDNPDATVLSIAVQEIGHSLGLLHAVGDAATQDVMFGTLQDPANTIISFCDLYGWKAVMHWLLSDGPTAHPPHVDSVYCGDVAPPPEPGPGPTTVVAHVESTTPFTVGGKKELRFTEEIQDADGNPVADASVSVELTLPNGDVLFGKAPTGADGKITFRVRQKAHDGTYTVQVTNVEKEGLTYDTCDPDTNPNDESREEFDLLAGKVVSETVIDDC